MTNPTAWASLVLSATDVANAFGKDTGQPLMILAITLHNSTGAERHMHVDEVAEGLEREGIG